LFCHGDRPATGKDVAVAMQVDFVIKVCHYANMINRDFNPWVKLPEFDRPET